MDPRRPNRTVIDTKVRQVGFITPGGHPPSPSSANSVPTAAATSPPGDLSAAASLSPVMIPPPRHSAVPVPVPLSPLCKENLNNLQFPIGSYNPSQSLASPSWSSRMDVSEFGDDDVAVSGGGRGDIGKGASSLPGSSGEKMMAAAGIHGKESADHNVGGEDGARDGRKGWRGID